MKLIQRGFKSLQTKIKFIFLDKVFMKSTYYKLPADEVYKNISKIDKSYEVTIEGISLSIHPYVYPSEKFRTTCFVLRSIKDKLKGKNVCDMGCGPGIVGLYALHNGAVKVLQADINPYAVENAIENAKKNGFSILQTEIVESNCFDRIRPQIFDIVIWNIPFHNDDIKISDPLEFAFYDPNFSSVRKFLSQIPDYSRQNTEIFIAFSSKGDFTELQKIFESYGFNWLLWKVMNQEQQYDNRIYSLTYSHSR